MVNDNQPYQPKPGDHHGDQGQPGAYANRVSGVFLKWAGTQQPRKQFLSDTAKEFYQGALYFDVTPNADSLKPVQDFCRKIIMPAMRTDGFNKRNRFIVG